MAPGGKATFNCGANQMLADTLDKYGNSTGFCVNVYPGTT